MAGIYIHIPFCRQACHYCNFHFATSLRYKDDFVAALLQEIRLQRDYVAGETIDTIYFGGGTPSLLSMDNLRAILNALHEVHTINPGAEITLEANPDDINTAVLHDWKEAGINRLSIGVQSFFEEDLQWMNRAHNSVQAIGALKEAMSVFDNLTIDLIYGTPQLTDEKWKQNVDRVVQLGIPHISCYALTVEPKTPLDKLISQHKSPPVDPEKQSQQFLLLMDWLGQAGYEHYEISNFSLPGKQSRHNTSYWQGKKYLGLGPSAHSFNGRERQWNVANNTQYIDRINKGEMPFEKEVLTPAQQLNEYIMTALRTSGGVHFSTLQEQFGIDEAAFIARATKPLQGGLLRNTGSALVLTKEGKLFADGIAADLFY